MKKTTFIKSLFLMVALLIGSGTAWAQGSETFTNAALTTSYADGSFAGDNGVTWSYIKSRDENNTPINGKGIMLQKSSVNSSLTSETIPGGIGSFTCSLLKGFTGKGNRQVELFINGESKGLSVAWDNTEVQTFSVPDINIAGDIVIEIRNVTSTQVVIDDISWTAGAAPTSVSTPSITATGTEKATDDYFYEAEITLSTSTDGATIHYTTNNSEPSDALPVYSIPFTINETMTIKAIAIKDGLDNSDVVTKTITISAPATATVPYTEAFDNTLGGWVTFEVAGSKPWVASANGAFANGFGGGDVESWLISPGFTAGTEGLALSMNYASKYVGNPISVKMSSNYSGYGNPLIATWTELSSIEAPTVQDDEYTLKASGDIVAATTGAVYFAIVYSNNANPYSDWRITNVSVNNYSMPTTPTITVTELTVPAMEAVTGLSDSETVNVSGIALTADIQLSITGTDAAMFSVLPASIVQTDGVASSVVTVSYNPTAPGTHTATLKFNSTGATEVVFTLNGTSALANPVAVAASGISTTGFTANWNAVAGTTDYLLNVFTKGGSELLNLVSNPGFENNETTSWNFEAGMNQTVVTDQTKSGTYALKVNVSATKKITQSIAIESGKEYTLSFWYYLADATTGNGFRVWTTVGAEIKLPTATTYYGTKGSWEKVEHTFTASANSMTLELRLYNGATLYLDDFAVIGDEITSSTIPITGSPFTVTGDTSEAITGLIDATDYYYTVVAKNGVFTSAVSNEVKVTTGKGTGLSSTSQSLKMRAVNGNIVFNTEAGRTVEVYNSIGQKISNSITTEGLNSIPARVKGVVFVKIGTEVSKLIVE